jgi:polyhydroxyalkanoate synthesis regulator phasin
VSAAEALLSAGEAVVAQTGVQEAVESAANVMKFVNEAQKRAYEDITFSLSSRIRDILKGYIGVPTEVRELSRSVDKAMSDLVSVGFTKEQAKAAVNEVIGGAKRTWRHEPSKISKFLRNRVSPEALDRMIMHGERLERELQGGFGYLKEHMEDTSKIPEFLLGSLKEGQRKKAAVGAFYKVLSEFGTYSREKNMYLANILKDLRVTYGLGAESSTTQNFIKDLTAVWRKRAGLSRGGIITSTETVDGLPWEPIKKAWNMEVRKPGFSESEFFDKILYKIMSSKEGVLDELVGVFENLSVDDPAEMALITDFLMDRQSYGTVLALRNNEEAMRAVYMLVEGNPIFLDDEVHLP